MRPIDKVVLDAIRDLVREQRQVPAILVRHVVDLLEDAEQQRLRDASARRV